MSKVTIYTDGGCRGNPGPGGWGVVLIADKERKELKGYEDNTTNNRMELTAAIKALKALKKSCEVDLYTDSVYVRTGITDWIHGWKKRGWRTAGKKPVKNVDLWQLLDEVRNGHTVSWHWVKGHSGDVENERADELANEAIDELQMLSA